MFSNELYEVLLDEFIKIPSINYQDKESFGRHLQLVHSLIVASENLLIEASQIESPVQYYYLHHLEEERGHDKWIEEDIRNLGIEPRSDNFMATCLAGSQYYIIKHISPVLLIGYMAVLEWFPVDLSLIDKLEELYPNSIKCLKHHAIVDVDHKKDMMQVVDELPEEFHEGIIWNAINTIRFLSHLVRS